MFITLSARAQKAIRPHIELNQWSIDHYLDQPYMIKILKFGTSWCGYCKELIPHINDYDKYLQKYSINHVKFYTVDCDKNKDLCKDFGVKGYPHIIIFNPDGYKVGQINGYYNKDKLFQKLDKILDKI